jgi:oxalate decarboxylase
MTVFASSGRARTFDYQAGDVGYVPFAMGHYIENTGDEPLRLLEMFRSDRFADVSLSQWMALTPPELVQAHLNLEETTIRGLSKDKPVVVAASPPARAEQVPLPRWPSETIAVLTTLGDERPYAIPVTAPVRAGDRRILLALHHDRESLQRLRSRAEVALTILAAGNEAFTARGRASVIEDAMPGSPGWTAIAIDVTAIDDHRQGSVAVEEGIGVRWTTDEALTGAGERMAMLAAMAALEQGSDS